MDIKGEIEMIEEKYLPLGTIVLLKEAKKRICLANSEIFVHLYHPKNCKNRIKILKTHKTS